MELLSLERKKSVFPRRQIGIYLVFLKKHFKHDACRVLSGFVG